MGHVVWHSFPRGKRTCAVLYVDLVLSGFSGFALGFFLISSFLLVCVLEDDKSPQLQWADDFMVQDKFPKFYFLLSREI